jgi:N-terminal half of MaoC dehydratase
MTVERFPVEASHIMMFARAIADPNPIYADGDYAATTEVGAVIAPPTFVQASAQFDPDYFLRPKLGQPWFGSGKNPSSLPSKPIDAASSGAGGAAAGVLHAEQHYIYHRPLTAGEVLTTVERPGETWEKMGRKGGKLVFSESITEYRTLDGELVVTARGVGVRTEKVVEAPSENGA